MKVLFVHNYYRTSAPSGEDLIFDRELALLRRQPGWDILLHSRRNDELANVGWRGLVKVALRTPWNQFELEEVRNLIRRYRPDVMHVHSLFPQISPAIMYAAAGTATATVRTLHNYRMVCANGLLLREGEPCMKCLDSKSTMPALLHRCYRDSLKATLPTAASISLHHVLGTWTRCVDAFITFTPFQRDLMVRAGIPESRIYIKPNWMATPESPVPWAQHENRAVFVGRLTQEKGVDVLIEAWKRLGPNGPRLEIIGYGAEFTRIKHEVECSRLPIVMAGYLSHAQALSRIRTASLVIVPSVCFEGFGLVVLEAMAMGVPVLASDLGSLPTIVRHGWDGEVFPPGVAAALAAAVQRLFSDSQRLREMGRNARENFEANYTEAAHLRALSEIYEAAVAHRRDASCALPRRRALAKDALEAQH